MKGNRKISRSEKKLFLTTGFVVAFIIAFGAWRQWVDAIPEVEFPTQKMPSPNAYDFYVKAGAAYVPAKPSVDPIMDVQEFPKAQWKARYPTAAKEAWLRRNATSLNLLRSGFKFSCRVPPKRSSTTPFGNLTQFRTMARMLSVESHAHAERGNWNGAVQSALDISQLSHDISKGGVTIDYLVTAATNAIGRYELSEILPHLNASEARSAARRMEKMVQARVSFADVLREEKLYGQSSLLETMHSGSWQTFGMSGATGLTQLNERWQIFKTPRRVVFNNYSNYMESIISEAEKPYQAKSTISKVNDDFYSRLLRPGFDLARLNYARDATGNDLFLVSLALRAYYLQNQRYPQTLNQLVPNYLKKIPTDNYGKGEPLRYKLGVKGYTLYSIGPDGIDNQGTPIEDKSKTGRGRYLVFDGKGDYVAGINH